MPDGEGKRGSRRAATAWELEYKLRFVKNQDPRIECTIHADGTKATLRVRAVSLSVRMSYGSDDGPLQTFLEEEITTVASDVGTLVTVQLPDGAADGSIEHLMVVLPTVPIGSDTPDDHTFDHVEAAVVWQRQKAQPGAPEVADRPHKYYTTQVLPAQEYTGSSVLARRRRGGGGG